MKILIGSTPAFIHHNYNVQTTCAQSIYLKDDKDDDPATGSIVTKVSKDMGYESIYSI